MVGKKDEQEEDRGRENERAANSNDRIKGNK